MRLAGAPALTSLRGARAARPRCASLSVYAAGNSRKARKPAEQAPSRGRPTQKAEAPPAPVSRPAPAAPSLYPPPTPATPSAAPTPVRVAPTPTPPRAAAQPVAEEAISSAEALPQVVSDRILGRIVTFSGLPLLLGFSSGPLAYCYKVSGQGELPKELLYTSGTAIFALAAAGISYGVLSASWDPRKAGSALGIDEFRSNLPIVLDKFFKRK